MKATRTPEGDIALSVSPDDPPGIAEFWWIERRRLERRLKGTWAANTDAWYAAQAAAEVRHAYVKLDRKRGVEAREAYKAEDPDTDAMRDRDAACLREAEVWCQRIDDGWPRGKLELAQQVTGLKGNDSAKTRIRRGLALMTPNQSHRWTERADAGKRRKDSFLPTR
ncbi:MAG: hypothetical protein R3C27_11145 [Hyphomonadaceae bacterium]